jgi:signal transduction histidine kinase
VVGHRAFRDEETKKKVKRYLVLLENGHSGYFDKGDLSDGYA